MTPIPKSSLTRRRCWENTVPPAQRSFCGEGSKNGIGNGAGGSGSLKRIFAIPIRFTLYEDEWGRAEVAHYEMRSLSAFKNKIAQFPTGTVFKWKSFNEGPLDEDEEKRFRKLESILAEQGARIVK